METVKKEEEGMDGDSEERGSAWMEIAKRKGVHGWRQ